MEYIGVITHLLTFTIFLGHQSSHPQLFLWKNHETKLWQSWVAKSIETDHALAIHGILLKTQHRVIGTFSLRPQDWPFWGPIHPRLYRFIHPSIGGSLGILRVPNILQPEMEPKTNLDLPPKDAWKKFQTHITYPKWWWKMVIFIPWVPRIRKKLHTPKKKSFKQQKTQCRIPKYLAFVGFSWRFSSHGSLESQHLHHAARTCLGADGRLGIDGSRIG